MKQTVFISVLLAICSISIPLMSQISQPDHNSLPEKDSPRAYILLLGTFHFDDAGLDDFQPQVDIDIKSPERQAELDLLLQNLIEFNPNKIAVEWPLQQQDELDSAYSEYLNGETELTSNEIHQVGFRLADELKHLQLWAIDAPARWYDENVSTEILIQRAQSHGQFELIDRATRQIQQYHDYHAKVDSMKSELSLIDYLLYLNSPEHLKKTHGQYLTGQIEVGGNGDYIGADTRTAWFNRNIRIFTNIQRMIEQPGERILVIIGSGHVPILKHLIEYSPRLQLIEPAVIIGN